jgi:hypothetical protein
MIIQCRTENQLQVSANFKLILASFLSQKIRIDIIFCKEKKITRRKKEKTLFSEDIFFLRFGFNKILVILWVFLHQLAEGSPNCVTVSVIIECVAFCH